MLVETDTNIVLNFYDRGDIDSILGEMSDADFNEFNRYVKKESWIGEETRELLERAWEGFYEAREKDRAMKKAAEERPVKKADEGDKGFCCGFPLRKGKCRVCGEDFNE